MKFFLWTVIITLPIGIVCASFFEWALHKDIMHKPVTISFFGFKYTFKYAFRQHAQVHHQVFGCDHTYHLIREKDKNTIPMAWWNSPLLTAVGSIPFILVSWIFGNWWICLTAYLTFWAYYGAYESLHWCMHFPKERKRLIERFCFFFRWINGHHILHHRYMNKNFNVVLPIADIILGTKMWRSPKFFNQPQGRWVPNIQPL